MCLMLRATAEERSFQLALPRGEIRMRKERQEKSINFLAQRQIAFINRITHLSHFSVRVNEPLKDYFDIFRFIIVLFRRRKNPSTHSLAS